MPARRASGILALSAFGALTALAAPAARAEPPPAASPALPLDRLRDSALDIDRALALSGTRLDLGAASLEVARGLLVAAETSGRLVETVFLGDARLRYEPPDAIEAGQLELFTGAPALDVPVAEAVLVLRADALPAGATPPGAAPDDFGRRAAHLFARWRASPERRRLELDGILLRDALGEPGLGGYAAAWLPAPDPGPFVYELRPDAPEQVSLRRFHPVASGEGARDLMLAGGEEAEPPAPAPYHRGNWDTWVSTPLRDGGGTPLPGSAAFDADHYRIEARIGEGLDLEGTASLTLQAVGGGRRTLEVSVHPDAVVRAVRDGEGAPLFFLPLGERLLVDLGAVPAPGAQIEIALDFGGYPFHQPALGNPVLRGPTDWYPRLEITDLATYDVTLRWPRRLQLVAPGRRAGGGEEAGERWERRTLDLPASAFSFEVGSFDLLVGQAGTVRLNLAFDPSAFWHVRQRQDLLATISECLELFAEVYGPYPLEELSVATTARPFSQAMLGLVTLSSAMISDGSRGDARRQLAVRRAVVSHEIAHQWWGHLVGWSSYRDRWISEAMANYSTLLHARRRSAGSGLPEDLFGWGSAVTRETADERPLESLGPLVLGRRLASTYSTEAFRNIVYGKGTVVLNMLAHRLGEATFLAALRELVARAPVNLSTEAFLDHLAVAGGRNLDAFARQFVYGTGLPRVFYDYETERAGEGRWTVRAAVHQLPPFRFRYRVERRDDGRADVVRQRVDLMDVSDSALEVPIEITLAGGPPVRGGRPPAIAGSARIEGMSSAFETDVGGRPLALWLDPGGQVFARFFNERRHPKLALLERARDAAASRHDGAAESLLLRALETRLFPAGDGARVDRRRLRRDEIGLDFLIYAELARLHLDADRLDDARAAFAEGRKLARRLPHRLSVERMTVVEARLAVREGNPERALRLLRPAIVTRREVDSTEGYLLLAIAAQAAGERDLLDLALRTARRRGAGVAALAGEALAPGG